MLRRSKEKKILSLNKKLRIALAMTAFVFVFVPAPAQSAAPVRLERAHAHNDYDHQRPLFEALENGFKSVEADIYLVGNQLFIGHDYPEPTRTLESLYLDPLLQRVQANGGSVYPGDCNYLTLLVDVKTEATTTYAELDRHLQSYASMLTSFTPQGVHVRAVTIIVSGNRDRAGMRAQQLRYASYDGRLSDVGSGDPNTFIPLISDNWTNVFTWKGTGPMPDQERQHLNEIVSTSHAKGQRVRFWNTPDAPGAQRDAVWQEELRAGVDYFNTDDLSGLQAFLLSHDSTPSKPYVSWFSDVALAVNGGAAIGSTTQSSGKFPVSSVIDGDRTGATWGSSGGWNDGTRNAYPDTLEVDFNGSKTICEIRVYTLQNNWTTAGEPTVTTPATGEGILDFDVQYWSGTAWVTVPNGSVTGNNLAMRVFTCPLITTSKIRVVVNNARNNWSRIVEVEAFGTPAP